MKTNKLYSDLIAADSGVKLSAPCWKKPVVALPGMISATLRDLRQDDEAFAILEQNPMTYVQTSWGQQGYVLEYQDGSVQRHYRARRYLTEGEVSHVFQAYADGYRGWFTELNFDRLDPKTWEPAKPAPRKRRRQRKTPLGAMQKRIRNVARMLGGVFRRVRKLS